MTSREKKKRDEKNKKEKTSTPASSPVAAARRAARARNAPERAQTRRGRSACERGRVRKKSNASGAASNRQPHLPRRRRRRATPARSRFGSRGGCVARRRAIRATKTIAASSDIEKTQRNLGDRHKGARRRRARYRPQRRARDGRSARFARRLRRSTRRRHIKNQQNKPWVAAAYAPSFAVSVATTGAVFVSGAFVVSLWIDSRRVGVRENSGFGRDARARARRRRERWANGKRYRRWLEIASATRRGRAVPAPWPTPGPRVEGSGLLV